MQKTDTLQTLPRRASLAAHYRMEKPRPLSRYCSKIDQKRRVSVAEALRKRPEVQAVPSIKCYKMGHFGTHDLKKSVSGNRSAFVRSFSEKVFEK